MRFLIMLLAMVLTACASAPPPTTTDTSPSAAPPLVEYLGSGIAYHREDGIGMLILTSKIDKGDQDIVRSALAAYPDISIFMLVDSRGGYVIPAQEIGLLVRQYGLMTVANGYCASACVDVFVAGARRVAFTGVTFGIHSPNLVDANVVAMDSVYYNYMGVPQMMTIYEVPHDSMFTFDGYEAVEYGIAHVVL